MKPTESPKEYATIIRAAWPHLSGEEIATLFVEVVQSGHFRKTPTSWVIQTLDEIRKPPQ